MTQFELESAVARATGEDLREIRRRGFSMAAPVVVAFDPQPFGAALDGDRRLRAADRDEVEF